MATTSSATGEHGQDCHSHSKAKLLCTIFEGRSSAGKDQSMMLSQMVVCAVNVRFRGGSQCRLMAPLGTVRYRVYHSNRWPLPTGTSSCLYIR